MILYGRQNKSNEAIVLQSKFRCLCTTMLTKSWAKMLGDMQLPNTCIAMKFLFGILSKCEEWRRSCSAKVSDAQQNGPGSGAMGAVNLDFIFLSCIYKV